MFQDSKYEHFNYIHLEKNSKYVVDLYNDSKNLQWLFSGTSNFFFWNSSEINEQSYSLRPSKISKTRLRRHSKIFYVWGPYKIHTDAANKRYQTLPLSILCERSQMAKSPQDKVQGAKKIQKEIRAENFSGLKRDINLLIQEAEWTRKGMQLH